MAFTMAQLVHFDPLNPFFVMPLAHHFSGGTL